MLLRSGRALAGPSRSIRRSCGSAGRLRPLKRKSSGDVEAAQSRKVKSKSPPTQVPSQIPNFLLPRSCPPFFARMLTSPRFFAPMPNAVIQPLWLCRSPSKQMAVGLPQPEVEGQAPLNLSVASEVTDTGDISDSEVCIRPFQRELPGVAAAFWWDNGDASDAELGAKLFPAQHPKAAAAMWNRFVTNAKLCIDHYNKENQANFAYKHSRDNGFFRVSEQDGTTYYHLNFYAQDKSGHSQLFFGEIEAHTCPKVENVTCCSPVFPSDAGGRSIRTIEEALKHVYPDWETVGMDYEHCYACIPRFKHPKGACYNGGHFADTRQYYGF